MAHLADMFHFISSYILPFLMVLTLIVFVHEMGHYLVGRWSGIRILAFSVGFGPEILGYTDSRGTRWRVCAIPLGGYVKFFGEEDADEDASGPRRPGHHFAGDRDRTFSGARLWKRTATVAAGPLANFILAIAIFAVLFSIYGRLVADPVVAEVRENSVAGKAGMLPGDLLVSIDGMPVSTFDDIRRYVGIRPETQITIRIRRKGETLDLPMVPRRTEMTDQFGNRMELGIIGIVTNKEAGNFRLKTYGPVEAAGQGVIESWRVVTGTFGYLANLVTGRMKADQLGGPIRVARFSGQMATVGIEAVLQLVAALSVSIGLFNLIPVPLLDGGHLMFYAVEAVRGKPVGPCARGIAYRIGLAMLLMLMVFTTWNDMSLLLG